MSTSQPDPQTQPDPQSESESQLQPEPKTYFPETWLFDLILTGDDGKYISKDPASQTPPTPSEDEFNKKPL